MNKHSLINKIKQLDGLTDKERSELVELLNTKKKYGLVWEEKTEDVEEELRTKLPVLREVLERRILSESESSELENEQNKTVIPKTIGLFDELNKIENHENQINLGSDIVAPNHILIEGDNLHALTALSFTHEGKIDIMYFDPPYNTGNKDFKYNDTFVDKEDSYRHSKWLSFMHKRLEIAKRLLSDKGVIFISIDDYEQATLKLLCDEIFGEANFVGNVIWQRAYAPINLKKTISQNHDFILIYCKQDFQNLELNKLPRKDKQTAMYKNYDNDLRGDWKSDNLSVGPPIEKNIYPITTPSGREVLPPKGYSWRLSKNRLTEYINDNIIWFGKDGNNVPSIKRFLSEVKDGVVAMTLWTYDEVGHTQEAKKELKELLHESENPFETVKPLKLINRILKLTTNNKRPYLILDIFAGSGTTLHATMQLNAEDGGNRQCILVTNNENNICEEITYERNRRVIQGYTNAKSEWVKGLTNNNLRYYRTELIPSQKTEQNKRLLTQASTELLQIKEDCFTDITSENGFDSSLCKLFTNERGKYLIVLFHSRKQLAVIELLVEWIKSLTDFTEKIKLYAFSPEKETLVADFWEVADKIEAVPLPEAIYNAYRATFKTIKLNKKPAATSADVNLDTDQE